MIVTRAGRVAGPAAGVQSLSRDGVRHRRPVTLTAMTSHAVLITGENQSRAAAGSGSEAAAATAGLDADATTFSPSTRSGRRAQGAGRRAHSTRSLRCERHGTA